jgi:ABC-type phosphate transport system substrate-binding protein
MSGLGLIVYPRAIDGPPVAVCRRGLFSGGSTYMASLLRRMAVASAVAGTMLIGTISPALADPPAGTTPAATDIVGVGSDTLQDVDNALSVAYNAQAAVSDPKVYSWDAFGANLPASITTKTGCTAIPQRPKGSSAGITALLNDTTGCIDFARSSRAKKTNGNEDSLAFFALGQDGVTWSTPATSYAPASLTRSQLASIYACSPTAQVWNQVGGKDKVTVTKTTKWVWKMVFNKKLHKKVRTHVKVVTTKTVKTPVPIHPYLPQSASGTRAFWESAIGVADGAIGACVIQGGEENNGTVLPQSDAGALAVYSVGKWVAQAINKHSDVHGDYVLHQIGGISPTVGTAATTELNIDFNPQFLRVIFDVVKKLPGKNDVDPKYSKIFGSTGYFCSQPAIIKSYGFLPLGGACGLQS